MKKIIFKDLPDETTPFVAQTFNGMQDNIEEAIQPIELTGIVEELPTSCNIGDKYFYKTDNKIYTAIDANTWDNGSIPSKDNFYINKSDNTLFYFNGESLVNIGGGQNENSNEFVDYIRIISENNAQILFVVGENEKARVRASKSGSLTIAGSNGGYIFLRPNGINSDSGECIIRSDGNIFTNGGFIKRYQGIIGDFNNAQTDGYYKISGQNIPNAPYTGYIYGKLITDIDDCTYDNNNWVWQTFIDTQGREYRRMRINGGEWQDWYLVSSVANDSFIKVKSDDHNEITFDTAFRAVKVNMASISTSSGNLSLSDGSVKIGAGISKIRATLKASWAEYQLPAHGDRILYIYKNNTQVEKLAYVVSARNYEDMSGDALLDVAEGDIIDMYVAVANPGTARFLDNTTMIVQGLK